MTLNKPTTPAERETMKKDGIICTMCLYFGYAHDGDHIVPRARFTEPDVILRAPETPPEPEFSDEVKALAAALRKGSPWAQRHGVTDDTPTYPAVKKAIAYLAEAGYFIVQDDDIEDDDIEDDDIEDDDIEDDDIREGGSSSSIYKRIKG